MCFLLLNHWWKSNPESVLGQNKVVADGNEISAGSVSNAISPGSATAPTVRENNVFTGSAEGNQDPALSTDGKKVPTGSVSRNNICSGSLVNNGVSAGHTGGIKDCAAPDDDKKDPTGSADGEKVIRQRQSRKVKEKQAVLGKYRWRTSICKETLHTDSSSSLSSY